MDENIELVFHGFLNLSMKEKMKLVGVMNEYFDSTDRESIRKMADARFDSIDYQFVKTPCKCCGR